VLGLVSRSITVSRCCDDPYRPEGFKTPDLPRWTWKVVLVWFPIVHALVVLVSEAASPYAQARSETSALDLPTTTRGVSPLPRLRQTWAWPSYGDFAIHASRHHGRGSDMLMRPVGCHIRPPHAVPTSYISSYMTSHISHAHCIHP
jgi:hypothetical protein